MGRILKVKEREYLRAVIDPFSNRVEFIVKRCVPNYEYIEISYREVNNLIGTTCLPLFEEDTMYKNMKINEDYNLRELEL